MTIATSASDRYDAARAALAPFDERTAKLGATVETPMERALADALRALIADEHTPNPSPEDTQQVYNNAYYAALPEGIAWRGDEFEKAHAAGREALFQLGIQAAWESWEPENAPGMVDEAHYDRIEGAIRLAFEGEGEAWSDKLSGDRLASVARRAIEEAGL